MDRQPKPEPGCPPGFASTIHSSNLNNMSISELVFTLRTAYKLEDFDRVEEVLLSRDKRLNADMEQLKYKIDSERLARFHAEEEMRKREELCEKGRRAQESYEELLKKVKKNDLAERDTIAQLRKKNGELEFEVFELRKLKKNNGELETEVCELKKLKEKWVDDNNALAELRSRVRVLEDDKITLAAVKIKNGELEEELKKNLVTIDELRNENKMLEDEKCKYEKLVESLNRKFEELQGRVVRLEDDTKLLMSVDGGNNEGEPSADPWVTNFDNDKDEEDVGDYEFGNDTAEPPSQRKEDTRHSLGATGIAQSPSKGIKDGQGTSSARGGLESEKNIEVIDLEDDEDDGFTFRGLHGNKVVSGITMKNEHPSSSAIRQKSTFANALIESIKRKNPFNDTDGSTSTSSSSDDLSNIDNLPLSSTLLHPKRRKT